MEEFEVVPWFSNEEWEYVCDLVISKDIKMLEDAYERLRCCKARCSRLPAGIECTLVIVEALLMESKLKEEQNNLSFMKSVYALAITRFLNHAASFEKDKTSGSLYRIAQKLNLPEWMVNLRHESAHGAELPSLDVLLAGIHLALEWLQSKYWARDKSIQTPVAEYESKMPALKRRLRIVMEFYNKVHHRNENDEEEMQEIECSFFRKTIKHLTAIGFSDREILDEVNFMDSNPMDFDEFRDNLLFKLFCIFKEAKQEVGGKDLIVDYFLEVSSFVPPSEEIIHIFNSIEDEPEEMKIPVYVKNKWEKLLRLVIQDGCGVLMIMLQKLVDYNISDSYCQEFAALWVKEILLGLKFAILKKEEFSKRKIFRRDQKKKEHDYESYEEQFSRLSELDWAIMESSNKSGYLNLSPNNIPDLTKFIMDILYNPRKTSRIYINDLLDMYEKPFSEKNKQKFKKAMSIYLEENITDEEDEMDGCFELRDVMKKLNESNSSVGELPVEPLLIDEDIVPWGLKWKEGMDNNLIYKEIPYSSLIEG